MCCAVLYFTKFGITIRPIVGGTRKAGKQSRGDNIFYFIMILRTITFFFIFILILTSCSKNSEEITPEINTNNAQFISQDSIFKIIRNLNSDSLTAGSYDKVCPGWWEKVKRWFREHTGSFLFDELLNCGGNYPCGPCPGICFRGAIFNPQETGTDSLDMEELNSGYRTFGIILAQNDDIQEKMVIFVFGRYVNDFVIGDMFIIPKDIIFSPSLAEAFYEREIRVLKGSYYVVRDTLSGLWYCPVRAIIK